MIVLAIDPGSRETGVVVRHGGDLLAYEVLRRESDGDLPDGSDLRETIGGVYAVLRRADLDPSTSDYAVGVEGVRYWPGYRNVNHLLGTVAVYGAVCLRWPDTVVAEPGKGYGSDEPWVYPEAIRPKAGGSGFDQMRHVRSAWDISQIAETVTNRRRREAT